MKPQSTYFNTNSWCAIRKVCPYRLIYYSILCNTWARNSAQDACRPSTRVRGNLIFHFWQFFSKCPNAPLCSTPPKHRGSATSAHTSSLFFTNLLLFYNTNLLLSCHLFAQIHLKTFVFCFLLSGELLSRSTARQSDTRSAHWQQNQLF